MYKDLNGHKYLTHRENEKYWSGYDGLEPSGVSGDGLIIPKPLKKTGEIGKKDKE